MEMHVSDYLKQIYVILRSPLLSFQKQKMSSKREYKHNTLTGRQSPQVGGGMYLT